MWLNAKWLNARKHSNFRKMARNAATDKNMAKCTKIIMYNINQLTDALARSSWSNCPLLDAMCELSGLQNLTEGLRQPALAYMGICSRTGPPVWRGSDTVYLEPR